MGFEEPVRTALLRFEDNEFAGAEVRCRLNVPMSTFFDIQRVAERDDMEGYEEVLKQFGDDILNEWNVESQGEPLPASGDGFLRISPAFEMMILKAWVQAVTEVPAPLEEASPNGAMSRELHAATVPLS